MQIKALPPQTCAPDCPIEFVSDLIGGRWKSVILYRLWRGPVRFGQLRRQIPGVTQRMLTLKLRELEKDGLIERTVYPEVPPHVDYRLSELGQSLGPLLSAMMQWSEAHQHEIHAIRQAADMGMAIPNEGGAQ